MAKLIYNHKIDINYDFHDGYIDLYTYNTKRLNESVILSKKNCKKCKSRMDFWLRINSSSLLFFILLFSSFLLNANSFEHDKSTEWVPDNSDSDLDSSRFSPDETSSTGSGYETCLSGEYLKGYTLKKGRNAGKYINIGHVNSFEECVEMCCDDETCKIALMLKSPRTRRRTCFKIECRHLEGDSCKPKSERNSIYHPYLFLRGNEAERPLKVAAADKHSEFTSDPLLDRDLPALIREKSAKKTVDQNLPSLIREKRKKMDAIKNRTFANQMNDMLDKDLPELIREKRKKHVGLNMNKTLHASSHHAFQLNVTIHNHTHSSQVGKAVCHQYSGSVCSSSLDLSKNYFYTGNNESILDLRLKKPMQQISSRLDGKCKAYALKAICYRFYPPCDDPTQPKGTKICSKECDELVYGECASEFKEANMLKYLQHIVPNCGGSIDKEYDENEPCVSITTDAPTSSNGEIVSTTTSPQFLSTLPNIRTTEKYITSAPTVISQNETSQSSNGTDSDSSSFPKLFDDANVNVTMSPPLVTMFQETNSTKKEEKNLTATIVDLPEDTNDKGTDLEELDIASSTPNPTKAPMKDSKEDEIRVSAGDNTEITLPTNEVSLYASTWPKETEEGQYSYKWTQIAAPKNGNGYMEGETTKNVKLTKLDIPGLYSFRLDVDTADKKHGVGFINITVKQKARLNRPPRAEVYPKDQTITLPTNTVVLDGSKSTDDMAIVSYKWQEMKGPIKHNSVFASSADSKILQLKNLIAGTYHFKLTVADADGEEDSTEATVTVKEEQDYPPEANAGSDIIVHLPNNTAELSADKSTDDKGILTYEWSKTADSPTCDMQGSDKSHLKLSRLTVGTYVFNLKVTDSGGHSSDAKVKVIVLPEINTKPVAIAGDDKELVYPDDATTLDGSKSQDNSKIVSFAWEQVSGPTKAKIVGANKAKAYLSELKAGTYEMKLSVTDDKGLVGMDTVKIHVKKDHNEPPIANAGPDQFINLPTQDCVIDGSNSHDDEYIEKYQWVRAGSSPAAGDVLNGSDHQKILKLANLIKGKYVFDLTVTDNKGLTGKDTVTINVREDPNHMGLVELYLKVRVGSFTEENKKQLARKISVLVGVAKEYVHIQHVEGVGKTIKIVFYVNDPAVTRVMDGKYISDILRNKIGQGGKLFEYEMDKTDPYVCRSNCSGHGYCDESTKACICDTFWMGNIFKANFGEKETNCDWSVLYLSVSLFGVFLFFIGVSWAACFCFARNRRSKRRARYKALRNADPDAISDEILLIPKRIKEKFSANSLTFTETDEDSEDDNTLFDKKRLVNGKTRMNGSANGKVKYRDHAM